MTRIVICRHGNTFDKGDIVTRVGGRTDMRLSNSGRAQAKALAAHFSPENSNYDFKLAFCSPLIRTHQTGDIILNSKHTVTKLKMLSFLTEIYYGIDENKPEKNVIARLGRQAIELWDEKAIPPQGWKVDPPNLIQSWKAFLTKHGSFNGDILVVTSNGIARFALDAVDEIARDAPKKLRTAAYGVIEIKNGHSKITAWDARAD